MSFTEGVLCPGEFCPTVNGGQMSGYIVRGANVYGSSVLGNGQLPPGSYPGPIPSGQLLLRTYCPPIWARTNSPGHHPPSLHVPSKNGC
jgi:hypothetical protein